MVGHRTRFRENGDLPPRRGSLQPQRKCRHFIMLVRLKLCTVGMRNAVLGNDLKGLAKVKYHIIMQTCW